MKQPCLNKGGWGDAYGTAFSLRNVAPVEEKSNDPPFATDNKEGIKVESPEELKICDPACGSGHLLVYAFDLLYAIYEEQGYNPSEIPKTILTHNLYGIEVDERAGELAAFALTMKAREKHRRFLRKPVQPQICVLENVQFAEGELKDYLEFVGRDLFTDSLQETLHQFEEAKNFGALIRPKVTDVDYILQVLAEKNVGENLFLYQTHEKVKTVLKQASFLSENYHVVIANPPYMGNKGLNGRLKAFLEKEYKDVKSDLFSASMVRITELGLSSSFVGMMTPFNWMFLSSFEKLRSYLLDNYTLTNLVRPEFHAFFDSAYVTICAFTLYLKSEPNYQGAFIDLQQFYGADVQPIKALEAIKNPDCGWFYRASAADFKKIPGSAIAYWVSKKLGNIYKNSYQISTIADSIQGMITGNNDKFLRRWYEVSYNKLSLNKSSIQEVDTSYNFWIPYNKGGDLRKWYGNHDFVLNWSNKGRDLTRARTKNSHFYLKPCITWTFISSSFFAARNCDQGFVWDVAGSSAFPNDYTDTGKLLCFMCSKVCKTILDSINPTLNYQVENILALPIHHNLEQHKNRLNQFMNSFIELAKKDWNAYETSWDFTTLPLLDKKESTLKTTYQTLRTHWQEMTHEMKQLEEENNRIFIEAYGLQDELTPDVPLSEITLTCNPYYRYDADKPETELETLLLADTIREFISYAVGCMFGRYSLDQPGLILANQGETVKDYYAKIPNPTFPPDEDNVIPILDDDWFANDITEQFRQFLRVTFGEENYEENLKFIETALGKPIRKYFLSDFYKHHLRLYKKRPIYWLFSSPKGTFNALIYMHRYRPDTVSIILNNYLREFQTKLNARKNYLESISISESASASEKTKASKQIDKLNKQIKELEDYDRDVLYPLATKQIEIDLDDGVKVNYPKFGKALKNIKL